MAEAFEGRPSPHSFQTQSKHREDPECWPLTPTVDDTGCDFRLLGETWEITLLSQRQQLLLTWPKRDQPREHNVATDEKIPERLGFTENKTVYSLV